MLVILGVLLLGAERIGVTGLGDSFSHDSFLLVEVECYDQMFQVALITIR